MGITCDHSPKIRKPIRHRTNGPCVGKFRDMPYRLVQVMHLCIMYQQPLPPQPPWRPTLFRMQERKKKRKKKKKEICPRRERTDGVPYYCHDYLISSSPGGKRKKYIPLTG